MASRMLRVGSAEANEKQKTYLVRNHHVSRWGSTTFSAAAIPNQEIIVRIFRDNKGELLHESTVFVKPGEVKTATVDLSEEL